jgi:hypothetical protein
LCLQSGKPVESIYHEDSYHCRRVAGVRREGGLDAGHARWLYWWWLGLLKSVNLTFVSRRVHTGGFMVDDMCGLVLTPRRIGGG